MIAAAVVREVVEETGVTVEITGLVGIYSDPRHVIAYSDGEVRQQFNVCLRARPTGGMPRATEEASEARGALLRRMPQLVSVCGCARRRGRSRRHRSR
jgi:ADP-ribose pyrophosphatase YjhB (NUDIX family)